VLVKTRSLFAAICLLAIPVALSGCKAPTKLEAIWPTASAERIVAQPPATPRWPLTGLEAPSVADTQMRVVSVKIENSPAARPQTGLDRADVVYEVIAEGGITRFHALFHSQMPSVVGPVRSARPPDLYLISQYHSMIAHVGGPLSVRTLLRDKTKYNDMDEFFNPASYWRSSKRAAPHNMYLNVGKLRALGIKNRGYDATATITGFAFNRSAVPGTTTVTLLTVPVSASNKVTWTYHSDTNLYARAINGKVHKDAVSGKQLTARNVIVIWARITPYPGDRHGVVDIKLKGSGRATVLRGGQKFDGTWNAGTDSPPTFRDKDGNVIKLDPGNTWIQVIGTDQTVRYK